MKVVVFGASGKVGRLIVRMLLDYDHEVTAFVHGYSPFSKQPRLKIVKGDINNRSDIRKALLNNEVVISSLGSWGTKTKDILTQGMTNIIPVMKEFGITRVVSLTGADALLPQEKLSLLSKTFRFVFSLLAGKIIRDGEKHLELLSESGLDWTVLRSPVMNDRGSKRFLLKSEHPLPWTTINREAVAMAMVELALSMHCIAEAPIIFRK